MKCNKKLSRVTEFLKDPESENELGTSKCGSHYVKEESYFTNGRRFCV